MLDVLDCTLTAARLRLHALTIVVKKNEYLTTTLRYFARAYTCLATDPLNRRTAVDLLARFTRTFEHDINAIVFAESTDPLK
jgi:hypothetical protein